MDQYHPQENHLNIDRKYYNTLNIEGFCQMMKNPSYCYKFYWLEAIVHLIDAGVKCTTFDAVINEMICNAWYSVREYHIHLSGIPESGEIKDGLERAVLHLSKISNLKSDASRTEILNVISKYDEAIKADKEQLTNMVPYRALAGFFHAAKEKPDWESIKRMTQYIRIVNDSGIILPYTLGDSPKLQKEIIFSDDWMQMIQDNSVNILGWIQYEKIKWLQNNNPEVPGLVYKLSPLNEKMRKLTHVRKLWEGILEIHPVRDVFTGKEIIQNQYEVDHFIPWSFVMNDELWDLMPMNSSLNSAKSDHLPKWELFFQPFAENQYLMYELVNENDQLHRRYQACYKDNLHSIWASQELYREGNTREEFINILEKNMRPVYDAAKRQGYEVWSWKDFTVAEED